MIFLAQDEKIIAVVRKHWFILFTDTFGFLVLYILPFAIYELYTGNYFPELVRPEITFPISFLIFGASVWTLIIWMKLSAIWADFYLDAWVVTDKRIVDIDQQGFFKRTVSSFRMERIQDITIDIHGVLPTILGYGDILVQTAGEDREFIMHGIGSPTYVKDLIREQSDMHLERGA